MEGKYTLVKIDHTCVTDCNSNHFLAKPRTFLVLVFVTFSCLTMTPAAYADVSSWPFDVTASYSYDSSIVEITGGVAKLKALDQTDDDNSFRGFGGGTNNETQWDAINSWLELTTAGRSNGSGSFTSRAMDAGGPVSWDNISWTTQRPLHKELPDNKTVESGYPTGKADMSNNVLLMHMNEELGTLVDYSGEGNDGTPHGGITYGVAGRFNTAVSLDGVDDYIDCGNAPVLDITDTVTIEAWINPTASGWTKKRPITISGASSSLTDYQVKLVVGYDSDMQSDYDDLRFFDLNGNEMNYWIEDSTLASATAWLSVASIPISGTTIYMYYGNPSATSASDGDAVFGFFDGFCSATLGTPW